MKPLVSMYKHHLNNVPTPINITNFWNLGSSLGMILGIQIITGILLSLHYLNFSNFSFDYLYRMIFEINNSWALRSFHANGASLFFVIILTHLGRGLYYKSYLLLHVWGSGFMILLILMLTSFVGYVLPWGQMSFWGATVIINFLSAVPVLGGTLVKCIWGDYSVSFITLNRLFSVHFLAPMVLGMLALVHMILLHTKGSNNPTLTMSNQSKTLFSPIFLIKDNVTWMSITLIFVIFCLAMPNYSIDAENFNKANALVTPPHIKPEWYYLFAYAILRAIPDKLGGIMALVLSLFVIMVLPFIPKPSKLMSIHKTKYWIFLSCFFVLSWLGAQVVEPPYTLLSMLFSGLYFIAAVMT